MKDFSNLFDALDQNTKTTLKISALEAFFDVAYEEDRVWAIALFSGRRPKRAVTTTHLRNWAAELADIPLWLFEDSYAVVGDLAETIGLVLPPVETTSNLTLSRWIRELRDISKAPDEDRKRFVLNAWQSLGGSERFVFNKLITGGMRVGVSQKLMTRALAKVTSKPEAELAHRLMGDWHPDTTTWHDLLLAEDSTASTSRPYPFYLAHGLEQDPETLGPPGNWQAEWKWDGIRGQLVVRDGTHFLWSRGEELITDRFPEFATVPGALPDGTVLDGELLVWHANRANPESFNTLQPRIGRKTVPKKLLAEAPVILLAYDVLEHNGQDLRDQPLAARRKTLVELLGENRTDLPVRIASTLGCESWEELARIRATARDARAEGVMLKRKDSPYLAGRKRGDWWKWKLDPLTIDAVMIYAQSGSGRRANLFTDYTFAVWDGPDLVPFTKAYSGLTDEEFRQITAWVRKNTQERFGPVRRVTPHHVFEIAFEGIQASKRHKSGVALRFPRMLRWRRDKPLEEAGTLEELHQMLKTYG